MRQVILRREELTVEDVTTSRGYIMRGNNGKYILARDVEGYYIWVKLDPSNITKPLNKYSSAKEAVKAKLTAGVDVFEFGSLDDLV